MEIKLFIQLKMTDYYFILSPSTHTLITSESEQIAIEVFNSCSINKPYRAIQTTKPNEKSKLIETIKQRLTESKK